MDLCWLCSSSLFLSPLQVVMAHWKFSESCAACAARHWCATHTSLATQTLFRPLQIVPIPFWVLPRPVYKKYQKVFFSSPRDPPPHVRNFNAEFPLDSRTEKLATLRRTHSKENPWSTFSARNCARQSSYPTGFSRWDVARFRSILTGTHPIDLDGNVSVNLAEIFLSFSACHVPENTWKLARAWIFFSPSRFMMSKRFGA
jgi:hypothetical protein